MAERSLSTEALRLLAVLREQGATARLKSLPDRTLAELTSLPARDIIDVADELLAHGFLVLAGGDGRWLGTAEECFAYAESLEVRGKRILMRAGNARRAAQQHVGQLEMRFEGVTP